MGEVYSHLSEEERRVIRIEIGNGTIICGIVLMLGRNASTVGREIKRRPRAAQGRPQARRTAQAPPPVMRTPVGAGGRMAGSRLVAAARQRQAARPVPRRLRHARVPGDRLPLDPRRPPSP